MGEFQRIARLRELFERPSSAVILGIGDDCAVLAPSGRPRVWTVDTAVAHVHFDTRFTSLEAVGYRAFMAAASDLAAMGATAVAALSSLILPQAFSDEELDQLADGLARAADACSCPIVGGNLARGSELSLTTSVLGECEDRVLTRAGARAGDFVYVTGPLGGAALGLRRLSQGVSVGEPDLFARAFLFPRARLDLSRSLAERASAAIDVSDGLLSDLTHLCRASGLCAELELERIPTIPGFAEAAREAGLDAQNLVLSGGDDYELLFTSSEELPTDLGTRIGVPGAGVPEIILRDATGTQLELPTSGFDHFR
jgi:thiamine-monophosphate kinase